ncbi:Zinc finger C2H2 [Penicillium sp. DV-2018c]|nr:Zinc finger C2H2 [Penicillium sp. DV-2018c]
MFAYNQSALAASVPPLDPRRATPRPSSVRNNTTQKGMYINPNTDNPTPKRTSSHRVSRAMKGKRVHACQRPGCSKVFTRAEHRRRHELSHDPKKKYPCTHEGCHKAFHRPDYLTQHLNRHVSLGTKENKPDEQNSTSPQQRNLQQQQQPQPQSPPLNESPVPLQPNTTDAYPSAWKSIDSSMSYPELSRDQSLCSTSVDDYPSPYSYTNEICSSPVAIDSFANSQYPMSGMPAEMTTAVDEYLRSILKPEAIFSDQQQMGFDNLGFGF